ncbi:MAG: hypothetical protein MJA27_03215, partial [Pseudanabaenales cyanobacterium]|nr:hypothetical protein [Pseudanabaenales cyanobacterium]
MLKTAYILRREALRENRSSPYGFQLILGLKFSRLKFYALKTLLCYMNTRQLIQDKYIKVGSINTRYWMALLRESFLVTILPLRKEF